MATEGNEGLGSSEEVPEGPQMGSPSESIDAWLKELMEQNSPRLACEEDKLLPCPTLVDGSGSLQSNRMVTERNEGLGLSDEVPERQQISPPLESVAAFPMEDSAQNTSTWLESYIGKLVREAFERYVLSGPTSVAAFLMEDSTQNTSTWLESCTRSHVLEAFERYVMLGPAMVGGSLVNRREQIQEPDRLQLRFETSMPNHFFVGKKVKGRDGAICVKLIDTTTCHVVESGPWSSLTLDVVVLAGDFKNKDDDDGWTWENFKSNVETGRKGKGPLLKGDLQVPLKAGVGSLAEFKFTDISTCRRSGKFKLGVKVESGFFMGIRVREAETAAFEVKHYKRISEEKHVPRTLDDEICTLKGIGKEGPFNKNLNDVGIFIVEDFLWKLCLDPEGLRKILGKTVSDKNWKTLGDHAKESVPSGKYHVYYADNMKNSGIVFKNMSELCGLIGDGKYYSAETLSDSQKVYADTLKRMAGDNWKKIVEYDNLIPLDVNQWKRPRFEYRQLGGGSNNPRIQGIVIMGSFGGNINLGSYNNLGSFEGNVNMGSFEGNVNMGPNCGPLIFGGNVKCEGGGAGNTSSLPGNDNMGVGNTSWLRRIVKCEGSGARNTSSLPGNVKCEGGGARRGEMASLDSKFEELSVKEPVD